MTTDIAISGAPAGANAFALIAGLPSAVTYFVADLCRDLLIGQHGACDVISLNDFGPETMARISAAAAPVILLAEFPEAAVTQLARQAAFPILVIDQPFSLASRDFMALHRAKLLETARTMARAHVGLSILAEIPRASVLAVERTEPASLLAERIATSLGIAADRRQELAADKGLGRSLADVLGDLFALDAVAVPEDADEVLCRLDRFYGSRSGGIGTTLDVPMMALQEGAAPHLSAINAINLTGPARCLTFGPYLHLHGGTWKAQFTFSATDNTSVNTLGFDVSIDHEVKVERSFEIDRSGKFAFECEFDVLDPYTPLEFRTFLHRGSIEGTFTPLSLTFTRCDGGTSHPALIQH